MKTILIIKDRYIKTFFLLKDKKHYEAWVLLERIEIDISFLEKNVDEDFIKNISWISTKRLLRVGNRYFLTKFSFSIGATIKQYTCSICGHVIRPRNKCIHKKVNYIMVNCVCM